MDLVAYYNEHMALHNRGCAVDWQKVSATLINGAIEIGKERDALKPALTNPETPPPATPPAQ